MTAVIGAPVPPPTIAPIPTSRRRSVQRQRWKSDREKAGEGAERAWLISASRSAREYEALKQTLLRLLDDPQVQQKIVSLLLYRFGKDLRDKGLSGRPI